MHVLLLEDAADVAQTIQDSLIGSGHSVDWKCQASAATDLEHRVHYDLVILDLTRPLDMREFEARLRLLQSCMDGNAAHLLCCANVTLDRASRSVSVDAQPVALTRREVALLEILLSRPGRIFGKQELVERLSTLDDSANANLVEQYVTHLRKKLGAANLRIRTLRGLGYQIVKGVKC